MKLVVPGYPDIWLNKIDRGQKIENERLNGTYEVIPMFSSYEN